MLQKMCENRHQSSQARWTLYLAEVVLECDSVIRRWARETIVRDRIAQNSEEDFQS